MTKNSMTFRPEDLDIAEYPDNFELRQDGVYYISPPAAKPEQTKPPLRICAPCWVTAYTRDEDGEKSGIIVNWIDKDGRRRERSFLQTQFDAQGNDAVQELRGSHFEVVMRQASRVSEYLGNFPSDARFKCVEKVGWLDDEQLVFVTPTATIALG
jgi:hypothetical protein